MARLTTSSYVKILLIILLGVGICSAFAFASCNGWRFGWGSGQQLESAQVDASSVKDLDIDWAAGSVTIVAVDASQNDKIEFVETAEGSSSRAQRMKWKLEGSTLRIDYGYSFACSFAYSKHLEIRIPKHYAGKLGGIDIDGASGTYRVEGIACDSMKVDLASGNITAKDVTVSDTKIGVASGKAEFAGIFKNSIKADAASGRITFDCLQDCPESIDADLVSGTVTVYLPENDGFTAKVDKVSGSFESDFATTSQGDDTYVHGNGRADIKVSLISGKFLLLKK